MELGASAALEAWNYNISHEELGGIATGITYGVREGLVLTGSWPMYFVSQRGVDASSSPRRSACEDESTGGSAGRRFSK